MSSLLCLFFVLISFDTLTVLEVGTQEIGHDDISTYMEQENSGRMVSSIFIP